MSILYVEVTDEIEKALLGLLQRASDLTPCMKSIGLYLVSSTQLRFRAQRAPDGTPWKPSKRAIAVNGETLKDTGRLRSSITYKAGPRSVDVGTNVEYAPVHQFGAAKGSLGEALATVKAHAVRNFMGRGSTVQVKEHKRRVKVPWGDVPARPFLGISPADSKEILAVIGRHYLKAL